MTNRIKNYSYLFAAILLVVSFMASGCKKNEAANEKPAFVENDTVAVKVMDVNVGDITISKTFSGTFEGKEQANVYTKLAERIVSLPIKVGSSVSKGSMIIGLDKSGATSQYYQALAAFENSKKDLERMQNLYKEGAISQQMLDGVQTQYNVAKANLDAAKNAVDLTAPISGIVTALNVNLGDIAMPSQILATIASLGAMKVVFNVGEADLPSLKLGQGIEIYSDLKPDLKVRGKITAINSSADVTSRTFKIEAEFSNTGDKFFKPGMFSRSNVSLKNQSGSIVAPNECIVFDNNKPIVYVVGKDNKAFARDVKVGITDGKNTEILSGLSKGEKLVVVGMNNLKDGKNVFVSK